jgi:prolyl 4-hydroxylase
MRKEVQRTSPPALKRAGRPLPWLRFSVAVVSLLLLALVTLSTPVDGAPSKDPVDECETSADGTCLSPEEATEPSPSNFLFPCNNSTLKQYLHDEAVPGFHIVCFDRFKATQTETREFLKLTYYRFGVDKKNGTIVQTFPAPFNWKQIRFAMERKLDLTMKKKIGEYQPWAVFTPMGQRVVDADMDSTVDAEAEDLILQILVRYQTLLIYEGGQFLWPGVEVGFTRPVNLYSVMPLGDPELPDRHQTVVLRTLSLTPLVFSVQNFLTDPECDYIQEKAEPSLEYSGVVLMDKDKGRPASDFRTSQSTFVSSYKDELMMDIEYRTASLVRIPRKHQEDVQVLRYGLGEK